MPLGWQDMMQNAPRKEKVSEMYRVTLRLPSELADRVKQDAEDESRSIQNQILWMLKRAYEAKDRMWEREIR